jgi:lysozyme family protein
MADFEKAYKRTMVNEGGYANHKLDRGGETYKGVARNYHPNWPGWKIIDVIKPHCKDIKTLNAALAMNQELQNLIHLFYKQGFWDCHQLDNFTNQLLAENVFDASVLCGQAIGGKLLQRALDNLNSAYNLVVDGQIGIKTFSAMTDALNRFGESSVVNAYVDVRVKYHNDVVAKNPSQHIFLNNWLSRCKIMRRSA